ncbi:ZPR1 zinc finger domain-containing protein [Thermoplasma sp.]|uniref:ZPR1 zinc finger domain-containing protein n=1 Tax=Thermoplasma sp. TaxID=1973142 RepID=UPI002632A587|nr:ZPR1 zinc finger domain-containing protein [Thermoplasma sp.]
MDVPREIQTEMECPVCGSNLYLITYDTEIPYEGKISIYTYFCKECRYKKTEVYSDEKRDPKKITIKVESPEDLRIIVYRSRKADVYIPEMEASIDSAEYSNGEITTIEGIVYRIGEKLDLLAVDDQGNEKIEMLRKRIDGIINGKFESFTLIIMDESGKSVVHSEKAMVESMD